MRSIRSILFDIEEAEKRGSQAQASVEQVECPRDSDIGTAREAAILEVNGVKTQRLSDSGDSGAVCEGFRSAKTPVGMPQIIKKAKLKGHSFSRWRAWENARMARA